MFARNGTCFWTIQLGRRNLPQVSPDGEKADSTPAAPIVRPPSRKECIEWARLPDWVQFGIPRGTEGEIYIDIEEGGWQCRAEVMCDMPEASPGAVVESCLRSLDEHGFDGSGVEKPEHSYYLSVLQWGHSVTVRVRTEAGEEGTVCVLNTFGYLTLLVRYSGPNPLTCGRG